MKGSTFAIVELTAALLGTILWTRRLFLAEVIGGALLCAVAAAVACGVVALARGRRIRVEWKWR